MVSELREKIKGYSRQIFVLTVVVLMTVLAAGMFRLYQLKHAVLPVRLEKGAFAAPGEGSHAVWPFMASAHGDRYYPVTCKAGSRIAESEKIYFATVIDAEKAGYTQSSECPH